MTKETAEQFYTSLIQVLKKKKIPFMVGGTYAFTVYTGIERVTKDMDIFSTADDYPKILQAFSEAGYKTALLDKTWIAKVQKNGFVMDVIFAEANGLAKVDAVWFAHAGKANILGEQVNLIPIESMIASKAYVQYRDRFDGADVINLILKHGRTLDWNFLLERTMKHWEILFAHILNFYFVYPTERHVIPQWVIEKLQKNLHQTLRQPIHSQRVTRGLLISSDYEVAVSKWGYKPVKK